VIKQAKGFLDDERLENERFNDFQEMYRFLSLPIKPGLVQAVEAGWMLGFAPHGIRVLMTGGLIKPVGHPTQQSKKFFCIVQLEKLRLDTEWKGKAVDYVRRHWQDKNHKAEEKRQREERRTRKAR